MRTDGINITIRRGEAFTVDYLLTNADGSPYIVSSELIHPYILVSVASNSFSTKNAYEYNQWCDLIDYYRFEDTNVVTIANISTEPEGASFLNNLAKDASGRYYYKLAVFYCTADGKYYVYKRQAPAGYTGDDAAAGYYEYKFRIVASFDTDVTKDWSSQSYTYRISLVSLTDTFDTEGVETQLSVPLIADGTIKVLNSVGGVN